jgi:hypothetical protein
MSALGLLRSSLRYGSLFGALAFTARVAHAQQPPPAPAPAPAPPAAQPAPPAAPPPLAASPLQPGEAPPPAQPAYPPPPGYAGTPNDYYYSYPASPQPQPPPAPPKPRVRNDTVKLTYATGVGMGPTHDFTPSFSFLGFAADWRTRVTDNFWPGFTIAWQVLYNKEYRTLTHDEITFTGTVATTLNTFPMLVDADYYLMTDRQGIRPYVGVGLGVYAAEHRIDWNIWTVQDTSWHFGFAPEAGVVLPTGSLDLVFTTKFNYAFASGGWDQILYWNFNIGVEL